MRGEPQRRSGSIGDIGPVSAGRSTAKRVGGDRSMFDADPTLKQQRHRRIPDALV